MAHDHSHTHHHHDPDPDHSHNHSHSHDHAPNGNLLQDQDHDQDLAHSHSHKPSHSHDAHRHSRNYSTNGYAFPPSGPNPAIAYAPPPPRPPPKRQQTKHTPFKHEHEHNHSTGFSPAKLTTPVLLATTLVFACLSQPRWSVPDVDITKDALNPLTTKSQPLPLQQFGSLAGSRIFQSAGISSGALLLGSGLSYIRGNKGAAKKEHPLRVGEIVRIAGTVWTVYFAAEALGGIRTAVLLAAAIASGVMGAGYQGIAKKWGFGLALCMALGWDVWRDTDDWTIPLGYIALLAALVFGKSAWPLEGVAVGKSAAVAGVGLGIVGAFCLVGGMSGDTKYVYLSMMTGAVGMVLGQGVEGQMGAGIALTIAVAVGTVSHLVENMEVLTELMLGGCAVAAIQFDKRSHDHSHGHSHSHDSHDHGHAHSHSDAPSRPPKEPSRATKALLKFFEFHPLIHSILQDRDSRRISYFMCLNFAFMMIQTAYGFLTGSLGLISDSVHMFFDCLALAVGVCAAVMSKWPPSMRYPYGLHKMDTLAGFANGIFLMLISIEITFEAFERLRNPTPMARLTELLFVSISGLAVNMVGIFAFDHAHTHGHSHGHSHGAGEGHSDNMHGIFLHILADALGSVSVVVSTVLIHYTAWPGYDPLASVLIALLIFASSVPLVINAAKNLLLTVSPETEYKLRDRIAGVASIRGVREYRAARFWEAEGAGVRGVLHVVAENAVDREDVKRRVEEWLEGMDVTVCVEREGVECWCRN